jgi:CRP-like cAMP-binding protein
MDYKNFYIEAFGLQDATLLEALGKNSVYKSIKKGTVLAKEGDIQTEVPFIISGAFQGSFCDSEGKEIVDCILANFGEPVWGSTYFNQPSPIRLKALIPSEVICVPVQVVSELMEQYLELEKVYTNLSLKSAEKHREAKQMLYQGDAHTRYEWFITKYSNVADKLTQKTIASFLGVSPSWLSKIKKSK